METTPSSISFGVQKDTVHVRVAAEIVEIVHVETEADSQEMNVHSVVTDIP